MQIAVSRGAEKFGTLVLNGQTICWIPAPAEEGGVDRQLTWLMPWEQFAAAMQSADGRNGLAILCNACYVPVQEDGYLAMNQI